MKKKCLPVVLSMSFLMQACFDGGSSGSKSSVGNGVILEGVAATGAPISNGTVEIMDAEGKLIPGLLKTDRYGNYSASVRGFQSPFLIVVSPISGDPVLSMASEDDVLQGKKVNVTPLTHVVVSNVYGETNTEAIKELQKAASEKREELVAKIETKKKELQDSLKAAMEALGVDAKIDIMNGSLAAGSGKGMDKLLDAIELKQEKETSSSKKSTIALKGGDPIVEVTPVSAPIVTPVDETKLSAINSQLTALEGIKEFYKVALADYRSIGACNGEAIDNEDSACDKTKLYNKMFAHMHEGYKYNGLSAEDDTWSWFCEDENEDEASDAESCKVIRTDDVEMTDFTIQNYKKVGEAEIAYVTFNIYENGVLRGSEGDYVRKDPLSSWKFYGNQRQYQIYLNARTVQKVVYEKSKAPVKSSEAQIEIWTDQEGDVSPLQSMTEAILVAVDSKGVVMESLNTALGAANNQESSSAGVELSTVGGQYPLYLASKVCPTIDPEAPSENTCNDWETNRITISAEAVALMNSSQRFLFKYKDNGADKVEEFYVLKPLVINEQNEAKYLPVIENESTLCSEPQSSYALSAPAGTYLNWTNFYLGAQGENYSWYNFGGMREFNHEETEGTLIPSTMERSYHDSELGYQVEQLSSVPSGLSVNYGGFYLSVDEQYGRQFTKEISCKYTWEDPTQVDP